MRLLSTLFNIFALLTISHADAVCAANITIVDKKIIFNGNIDDRSVMQFKEALDKYPSITSLRITSAGGNAESALNMSRSIVKRRFDVEVYKYCVSACAQYVFLAGQSKFVMPGAIVVFHGTPSSMKVELKHSQLRKYQHLFNSQSEKESVFYRELGLSQDLLIASVDALGPLCVAEDSSASLLSPNRVGVMLSFVGYMPSRGLLQKLGVKYVSGYWPDSNDQLQIDIKRLPFDDRFNVKFISEFDVEGAIKRLSKDELKLC